MLRRLPIVILLLLLPAGMLYPLWSCPTSAGEDDVVFFWPMRLMVAEQIRSGRWPLWNPTAACGAPLMGDPQTGTFFPPNWLFLACPPRLAYSLCISLAFATCGGGAWLYLRRLGLNALAAAFGSIALMFSGFMVGHRVHLGVIQTAAFLPWGLWAIETMRHRQKARDSTACSFLSDPAAGGSTKHSSPSRWFSARGFVALAPVLTLALAAGHWPTVVHMSLIWGAYLLLRARPVAPAILSAAAAGLLAGAILAPQMYATLLTLRHSVRAGLPYNVVGENSFFPLSAVLAFFPFLMGCRTQNLFGQDWWGPWHLCETLGYVGLATLVLAAAVVVKLYRKRQIAPADPDAEHLHPLVRCWTWIAVGAGIFMLGYYLPTYRLIYYLPVLGKVRCPARMVLAVDMGLATLAAIGVHALSAEAVSTRLAKAVRAAAIALPIVMLAILGLLAALAAAPELARVLEPLLTRPPGGASATICAAISPTSPAVYVPLLLAAATAALLWWIVPGPDRRRPDAGETRKSPPRRRAVLLLGLLLADLFLVTRFVDVPAPDRPAPDPQASPAAAWLKSNARPGPYRVWGLSNDYRHRPAELLLPSVCGSLGIESISYYGPLQSLDHARLLGFKPWGENPQWPWLLRSNHLLSLLNVRYILAAEPEHRQLIESVRTPARAEPARAPRERARQASSAANADWAELKASLPWQPATYEEEVALQDAAINRLSLDLRALEGAGNYVIAGVFAADDASWWSDRPERLRIDAEQLLPQWRHFEWYFQAEPALKDKPLLLKVLTTSDKPIQVRNLHLAPSAGWEDVALGDRLGPARPVYVDRTPQGLEPLRPGDPPVHIYENLLCLQREFPVDGAVGLAGQIEVVEALRWRPRELKLERQAAVIGGAGPAGTFVSENLCYKQALTGQGGPHRQAAVLGAYQPAACPAAGNAGAGNVARLLLLSFAGLLVYGLATVLPLLRRRE